MECCFHCNTTRVCNARARERLRLRACHVCVYARALAHNAQPPESCMHARRCAQIAHTHTLAFLARRVSKQFVLRFVCARASRAHRARDERPLQAHWWRPRRSARERIARKSIHVGCWCCGSLRRAATRLLPPLMMMLMSELLVCVLAVGWFSALFG